MKYSFSDNIQRTILYLLKSDKDFYLQIVNLVKPEHFEFPVHGKLFSWTREYYDKYLKLPTDDVIIEMARENKPVAEDLSDYQDEITYINGLDVSAFDSKDFLLDYIEDFARKQEVKEAIRKCDESG